MKVYSVNFLLKGKTPYKDLAPVFPDILKLLLDDIGQMPELKTYSKSQDLNRLADTISNLMTDAGIKFAVTQNEDVEFD